MRFFRPFRHVIAQPVFLEVQPGADFEDLSTWSNSGIINTAPLPGNETEEYFVLFDVTAAVPLAARQAEGSLRFTRGTEKLSHVRLPNNRILVGGRLHGGVNIIRYYWGKTGAVQPGVGFETSSELLSRFRLALIFQSNQPVDISPSPATFTTVGSPTYAAGKLGQVLQASDGNYISTTATKLRGDARGKRAVFAMARMQTTTNPGRVVAWVDWINDQRAFQLWLRSDTSELYVASQGQGPWIRWIGDSATRSGWNTLACSWQANEPLAGMLLNDTASFKANDHGAAAPGEIYNSNAPYTIGSTPVPGITNNGPVEVEVVFDLYDGFTSANQMLAWSKVWAENDDFLGIADRTPDNFDVPDLTGQEPNTEVLFAKVEIKGMSSGTPISISGDGNPTYSISSSFTASGDVKPKGSTPGTINPGQWVSVWHTTGTFSTTTESVLTIGTVQSVRKSSVRAEIIVEPPPSGDDIPTGPANYTVSSLSQLLSVLNTQAQPGQIVEIANGDYKSQGDFDWRKKDFTGGKKVLIRAPLSPYRGYMPNEGGLRVSGETNYVTGSGGAEFKYGYFRELKNVAFQNLRFSRGKVEARAYCIDIIGCEDLTFQNCKIYGYKPASSIPEFNPNFGVKDHPDEFQWDWRPYVGTANPYPNEWNLQPWGVQAGITTRCHRIKFQKCFFHYVGVAIYWANTFDALTEDCFFTDNKDQLRTDGRNDNLIVRRCVFYRTFPQRGTGPDVEHADMIQNTTKTQTGWQNHTIEMCLGSIGDSNYGKSQGFFYEHDNWPQYPAGTGLKIKDCLLLAPTFNTVYIRPSFNSLIENTTILVECYAGRAATHYVPPDQWPRLQTYVQAVPGSSDGSNIIRDCVYRSLIKLSSDQDINGTDLQTSQYAAALVDYVPFNTSNPSSWNPVRIANPYTGVVVPSEIARLGPKLTGAIHPNQKGLLHYGATRLFEYFGALQR